ncbi:hypothetical protein, partial [Cysteiniphilum sp. SYW-8]|uniref:hypothetical protein n=1 Tax=Cysteiniphilum sp. SYW-8 TaxID=2610890 RepID=UPI001CD06E40
LLATKIAVNMKYSNEAKKLEVAISIKIKANIVGFQNNVFLKESFNPTFITLDNSLDLTSDRIANLFLYFLHFFFIF